MVRRLLTLSLLALVYGCAVSTLKEGLPSFVGRNISEVVDVFGYPDAKIEMPNEDIYQWIDHVNTSMAIPTMSTSLVTSSTGELSTETTYGTSSIPLEGQCKISIAVNDEGIITNWEV